MTLTHHYSAKRDAALAPIDPCFRLSLKRLLTALILLLVTQAHALDWQDSPEIGKLFGKAGVQGTFVLYDVGSNRLIGHDRVRAFTPKRAEK